MSGFGYSVVGFLLAIAILVAVHEFGHFWVARKLGVKVLKFSIGFGRPLFRWQRKGDDTEYSIGMIPLGGYVKMLDEREGEVAQSEEHQSFNRQSLWVRSAIVAAGPVFNFLFAIVAIWAVFIIGTQDVRPVVGIVLSDSIAQKAGFSVGDTLVELDGKPVKTWGEHQAYLLHQAMKSNTVEILVEDQQQRQRLLSVDFKDINQSALGNRSVTGLIGIGPTQPPAVVEKIVPDSPAVQAGLVKGDEIVEIDGVAIADWNAMVAIVSTSPNKTLSLTIRRDGELGTLELTTRKVTVEGRDYGQIGLYRPMPEIIQLRYGWLESVVAAMDYNWRVTITTLRSLGRMLTAKMSSENLSGPITIARVAGDTVEAGLVDFLRFLALISISLGLINLLPIPVLDGGHLLYFAIEAVIGRPPSEKIMIIGQQIGIILLIMLMIVAFYNDIMRLIS